ncbi:MAG TPA: hypothetical protein PK677_06510 [Acidiphilium sp.]|nr:hypothetical protein [Acidiphilium sp.]HQU23397.1 hypothetical protein [Acidiphilium sp.]
MSGYPNAPAQSLTDRFTLILRLLQHILGNHPQSRAIEQNLKWAIWHRLIYFTRRFSALIANPPKPRPTPPVIASEAKQSITLASPNPQPVTPRRIIRERKGWLCLLLPGYQVSGARSQLMHLLDDPDLIALLSENPSLGRVLRPMCHMLRISLPLHLKLARKPQKPRKPRAHRMKPERKSPPKPAQTLYEYLFEKYPPPPRPTLPGHRYAFSPPFKNSA